MSRSRDRAKANKRREWVKEYLQRVIERKRRLLEALIDEEERKTS